MPRPHTRSKPTSTSTSLPTPAELRAATSGVAYQHGNAESTIIYLHGCNISWMPASPASSVICFGMYLEQYPAELARLFSDECYRQLPRQAELTVDKKRPGVDLSRTKATLVLKEGMWHPADALEWLFEWFLRFAEGDRSVPRAPEGVYSRFHGVELVNWLKLLDVAVFVGAHEWFVKVLEGKIGEWNGPVMGGRPATKKMKETIRGLDADARGDLVETVASALACGWLKQIPKVLAADGELCDEIKAAQARQQDARVARSTSVGKKVAVVLIDSSDVEEDMASQSSSTLRVGFASSRTGSLSGDGDEEMGSEMESVVEDSMPGRE